MHIKDSPAGGFVSRRARMIRATAFFLLLLQAASTHQASVPTDANLVLTAAAESLENVLGLDYNVLEPTFRDIDLVPPSLSPHSQKVTLVHLEDNDAVIETIIKGH